MLTEKKEVMRAFGWMIFMFALVIVAYLFLGK